jgi:hypothetical protein
VARRSRRRQDRTNAGESDANPRIRECWGWITVALVLFTTVDIITTVFVARVVGTGAGANPLIAWTLARGAATLAAGFAVFANDLAVVLLEKSLFALP